MEEQLISFETAKLAKDKGFNLVSTQGYDSRDLDYQMLNLPKGIQFGICTNNLKYSYVAPTQSLLQRWLRDKYKISIEVFSLSHHREIRYTYNIKDVNSDQIIILYKHLDYYFGSYEDALEIGLQEGLKLIK